LRLELDGQPVTDIHCFSFSPKKEFNRASLTKLFMAGGPTVKSVAPARRQEDLEASVAYRRMIHQLARLLGTSESETEVLRRREKLAERYGEYLELLLGDAGIRRMALDNGLEPVPFAKFKRYAPCELYRILRIEPLIKRLLDTSNSFEAFVDSFEDSVRAAVRKSGFVGFKSVIAYRTGLDVDAPTEHEARISFMLRRERGEREWFGPRVKPLRDFLLNRTAELSSRLGAFFQIHTGLGDTDIVAERCNPLLLSRFLRQEFVMKTPIVLIHGGYPYTDEAAWLSSVFPNVHFELSTPFPPTYLPAVSKERYRRVLEVVPTTRIVYGSDSIEIPEFHWLSAKLTKTALGEALGEIVEEGAMDEDDARRAAARILDGNGAKLLN
jgi:predicted TIM-barrel fold metal-dependent hydrolase